MNTPSLEFKRQIVQSNNGKELSELARLRENARVDKSDSRPERQVDTFKRSNDENPSGEPSLASLKERLTSLDARLGAFRTRVGPPSTGEGYDPRKTMERYGRVLFGCAGAAIPAGILSCMADSGTGAALAACVFVVGGLAGIACFGGSGGGDRG